MRHETLTIDKSLDLSLPPVPPRSHLYSLAPVGVGTGYVESLTGYIARLAEAHHVTVSILFGYELALLAGKEYLRRAALRCEYPCRIFGSAFRPLARAMNGMGIGASEWVKILQTLTIRSELRFLTMVALKAVLSQGQLLRPTRAWCPACYEERRERRETIYEPLLWVIKAVVVCPRHCQPLRTSCNYCQKSLHPLASLSRPGYCSVCGLWLGEVMGTRQPSTLSLTTEEMERQIWSANAVSELLAAAPKLGASLKREGVLKSLDEGLKGQIRILAQALLVDETTIRQWSKGKNVPQLESLLRLCHRLEVSLLDFVTGKVVHKCLVQVNILSGDKTKIRRSAKRRKPLNKAEAKQVLRNALEEMPPPTLQGVGARLGRDGNVLRYWFADLCKAVVTKYADYKKSESLKTWDKIKSALQSELEEESPGSVAQIALRLGYDVKTLRNRYPDLCRKISALYAKSRKTCCVKVRIDVRAKLQSLLVEFPPPSVLKTAERLGLSKTSLYKNHSDLCHQLAARYLNHRHRKASLS